MYLKPPRLTVSLLPELCLFTSFVLPTVSLLGNPEFDFFERNVRPLLAAHCYECHSTVAGKSKGNLLLDSRQGWQTGGDSGPAIIPHEPDTSLLIRAVRYTDPDLKMPPDGRLPEHQAEILEEWVRLGSPDPREGQAKASEQTIDIEKGKQFWAFQPPSHPDIPQVKDQQWPKNHIDFFILSRLEAASIKPVPPANELDIIRRLYFDLIGLPPTPEQVQEAQNLPSETRIVDLVDRLLSSKHFGETWGRHWLDLARYSESTGGGRSALLPNAWRYRNYVIDAFNNDKPYDQFIREQIAGDLLPFDNDNQRAAQLIATAFLVLGPKNLDLQDKELLRMNTVDEQIDTVSRVFMGMTVSCARCHDHKFDPIPAKDYYALAGIFRSTRTLKRSNVSTLTLRELPMSKAHLKAVADYTQSKKELDAKIKAVKKTKFQTVESRRYLASLENSLRDIEANAPDPIPQTLGVTDEQETGDYHLCIRGNVHQPGEKVPRGFLQVMMTDPSDLPEITPGQSGRLEFAKWLSSPDHPLAARVLVNRVWNHLFGDGIVATVDNFGTQGQPPTHPELLDYLATRFIQDGWFIKRLIRQMVLSQTYQLSSITDPAAAAIDAENRLRWRMPRKRLPAEAVRDAILATSGTLTHLQVECLFPESARNDKALQKASLDVPTIVNPPLRSIYIPVLREEGLNPLLKTFDFANPSFPVGKRNQSTLPTQALYLMNSNFVMKEAEKAAQRLVTDYPAANDETLLDLAYLRTLNRLPYKLERAVALEFIRESNTAEQPRAAWPSLFHSLFASVDFRFLR
ncbi:MAG: hypothetical protein M2R45_01625 [Verrucomicrobia subdivision 3 bacterium]|nr:hypothetical protein [Limisphaerales bacterium]MCS1412776.1 hypothetical protein [Limisphaerales bacterium]